MMRLEVRFERVSVVIKRVFKIELCVIGLMLSFCFCAQAQTVATEGTATVQARPLTIVQSSGSPVPQVVTVVHRLNGMKVLSLLHRDGQSPMVVGDEFITTPDMLTSVIAGFALNDGKSVVARLPQAEAEFNFGFNFNWPQMPSGSAPTGFQQPPNRPPQSTPDFAAFNLAPRPDLFVIQRDGTPTVARYVGLDVGTGLSLLQLEGLKATGAGRDAAEERLATGQRVRLLAPQRTAASPAGTTNNDASGKLFLAVSEIEGTITELKRSASGQLARLTVSAPKLTSAFAGGVALNEAGETIGIIESEQEKHASVLPIALVRRAAARVLARHGNVPQPWLGVRGQAVSAASLSQFLSRGWTEQAASFLRARQNGILLTAVAPDTPAAAAQLRSGDVILKLNESEVKSVEDFSFMLNELGSGATVNFTVLRGDGSNTPSAATFNAPFPPPSTAQSLRELKPLVVSVKLSESLNPLRWTWEAGTRWRAGASADPLSFMGVESIPLTAKAAARLGASGGRLVVFIAPESAASRAGLRVFDIIESVDGKSFPLSNAPAPPSNPSGSQPKSLVVVREGKRVSFALAAPEAKQK